jgi:CRISPR-associated protein Csm2
LRLKQKLVGENKEWEEISPYVNMIIAKAAYSKGRGHSTACFLKMIRVCINQVSNKTEYLIFCDFFESFIAFYKLYAKE